MQKCDLDKLIAVCKSAKAIHIVGAIPAAAVPYRDIFTQDITKSDTVVISSSNVSDILTALNAVTNDCSILITDCSNPSTLSTVQQFLDVRAKNFQYSRQMLVDSVREKSLLIRHTTKKEYKDRSDEISIFLVLRTGGPVYDSRYVNATAANIRKFITHKHEIVCITDNSSGITEVDRIVKMRHDWPKWWGKIELFRDDVTKNSHCLFMDLDTVCVDNIDYLCKLSGGFYGLRDFYNIQTFQTGVMKWDTGQNSHIYNKFTSTDITKYISKGDHEWIGEHATGKKFLQDEFPGEFCSYKKHLPHIHKKFVSPSVICFHGDPRPHTVKDKFITDVWKYK